MEASKFLLQALNQHIVITTDGCLQPIANQHQGGERRLELMGNIAHPAFLLLLLSFKRLPALDEQQHPFICAGEQHGFQWIASQRPFDALKALLVAHAHDGFLEAIHLDHVVELLAAHQAVVRNAQQTLGFAVDVSNAEVGFENQPALGGFIDPGQ